MTESLKSLLEGLIDYAGIFPPARLPLEEALVNYDRYRTVSEAWMLSRFICPAARLGELNEPGAPLFSKAEPFVFSALARSGDTPAAFLAALADDLDDVREFRAEHGRRVEVDVLEARLPGALLESDDAALAEFFGAVDERVRADGPPSLTVFYELPLTADGRARLERVVRALAAGPGAVGLKVRTGGLEPAAFPSPEQVAAVIHVCRKAGVAFKATAGLHHPIRRFDASVGTRMHGFLNLFGAAALAAAEDLEEAEVTAIVADEDAASFRFEPETLGWRQRRASAAKIREVRQTLAISYGSCSFDEPREDLKTLGLLG